jgi:hypothetical protein
MSTGATTIQNPKQGKSSTRFELLDHLLSFVHTDEQLNDVLAGYFCKLISVLVSIKPKEIFTYIYSNPQVFDDFIKHTYQKSISEILIRLLNSSENVFEEGIDFNYELVR